MATTQFFSEEIKDAAGKNGEVNLEIGRSSFLNGENLIYFSVDGRTLILGEKTGRELIDAFDRLDRYLNY